MRRELKVEFKLENGILALELHRIDGQYMGVIVGLDKFSATDSESTKPWLRFVILHASRGIG
jgi:hypothetical protein